MQSLLSLTTRLLAKHSPLVYLNDYISTALFPTLDPPSNQFFSKPIHHTFKRRKMRSISPVLVLLLLLHVSLSTTFPLPNRTEILSLMLTTIPNMSPLNTNQTHTSIFSTISIPKTETPRAKRLILISMLSICSAFFLFTIAVNRKMAWNCMVSAFKSV